MLRYFIHLKLIFLYNHLVLSFYMWIFTFPTPFAEDVVHSLMYIFWYHYPKKKKKSRDCRCVDLYLGLLFYWLTNLFFVSVLGCFDWNGSVIYLEIGYSDTSCFSLFCSGFLVVSGVLCASVWISILFSTAVKNSIKIWMRIMWIALGKATSTILIPPIPEHVMSFRSSLCFNYFPQRSRFSLWRFFNSFFGFIQRKWFFLR